MLNRVVPIPRNADTNSRICHVTVGIAIMVDEWI